MQNRDVRAEDLFEEIMKLDQNESFMFGQTKIKRNMDGIKTDGDLDLCGTNISKLPDNLKVFGYLDISDTQIISLPENLYIHDEFYINNTNIQRIPDCTCFCGSFSFYGSKLAHMQENHISGDLNINSLVEHLPHGLVVMGNLDLRDSKLKSLPLNLKVRGLLEMTGMDYGSLPNGLEVDRLYLSSTKITALPENLYIGEYLDISDTSISSIPESAVVSSGAEIEIGNSNIRNLPPLTPDETTISIGSSRTTAGDFRKSDSDDIQEFVRTYKETSALNF